MGIERVGMELRGVTLDFRGHVARLVGNYKRMALQMLSVHETGSMNTVHYENWLLCEFGDRLGFDTTDVRRAKHDEEVRRRFRPMSEKQRRSFEGKMKEHFDIEAMLKAFVAEANSFGESSSKDSLARQMMDWANDHMTQPHVIFDDACTSVIIDDELALAIVEVALLGRMFAEPTNGFRGVLLCELFQQSGHADLQSTSEDQNLEQQAEDLYGKSCDPRNSANPDCTEHLGIFEGVQYQLQEAHRQIALMAQRFCQR